MTLKVGIIDAGVGNTISVKNSLLRLGADAHLISCPSELALYDRIILPGVGAFPELMKRLHATGFSSEIKKCVLKGVPLLGICLGMQVLFEESEEFEKTEGLGLISGKVVGLPKGKHTVPNVGWWSVKGEYKKFASNLSECDTFYFVHSYCVPFENQHDSLYIDFNGSRVLAAIKFKNCLGFQFHPEKSQKSGDKLFKRFLES